MAVVALNTTGCLSGYLGVWSLYVILGSSYDKILINYCRTLILSFLIFSVLTSCLTNSYSLVSTIYQGNICESSHLLLKNKLARFIMHVV